MAKGNIRSIRFSNAILEMIEQQPGDTFTAKYEGLITKCCWELPQKEQQLAEIRKQIENEQKNLRRLREQKQRLEGSMIFLERSINNLRDAINRSVKELEQM